MLWKKEKVGEIGRAWVKRAVVLNCVNTGGIVKNRHLSKDLRKMKELALLMSGLKCQRHRQLPGQMPWKVGACLASLRINEKNNIAGSEWEGGGMVGGEVREAVEWVRHIILGSSKTGFYSERKWELLKDLQQKWYVIWLTYKRIILASVTIHHKGRWGEQGDKLGGYCSEFRQLMLVAQIGVVAMKLGKVVRVWVYFEHGPRRICWWIRCGTWEKERGQR